MARPLDLPPQSGGSTPEGREGGSPHHRFAVPLPRNRGRIRFYGRSGRQAFLLKSRLSSPWVSKAWGVAPLQRQVDAESPMTTIGTKSAPGLAAQNSRTGFEGRGSGLNF